MSKNRFEQLIEYVINDEDAKAKELFHQIVVEKSRQIYENLMQEEDLDEDNAMGMEPTEIDTDMDEGHDMMGGSQTADLIDDVEAEESGMQEGEEDDMSMDGDDEDAADAGDDEEGFSMGDESGDEPASKDDIMNLEDKLDQLMAEFENMMGGQDGDAADMMSADEVDADEYETEGMMENITLKQVHPKTTTQEEGNGKSGPVAFNSGAAGMASKPVRMTGDTAQGRTAPTAKDMIGKVGNSPSQSTQAPKPATKPHTAQATGVNTKSPLPGGRRG